MTDSPSDRVMTEDDFIQVRQVGVAAYLYSVGIEALEVVWIGDRAKWKYLRTQELEAMIDAYNSDEITVNPRLYYGSITAFKRKLYDARTKHQEAKV